MNMESFVESFATSFADWIAAFCAGMTVTGLVLFWLFCALVGLAATFLIRIYIAYRMAKNRHRDPLGWVLLSFFVSPLMTWIILLIVGNAD